MPQKYNRCCQWMLAALVVVQCAMIAGCHRSFIGAKPMPRLGDLFWRRQPTRAGRPPMGAWISIRNHACSIRSQPIMRRCRQMILRLTD